MGCAQSRLDNEESVSRCKDRKNLMKEAVVARNAFAANHSGYAVSLKNTGAALSDYGHGETEESHHHHHNLHLQPPLDSASDPPPPPPPIDNLPPPPPPLPNFSPSPIKRAMSMPEIPLKGHHQKENGTFVIAEEEEEEHEAVDGNAANNSNGNTNNKDLSGARGGREEEQAPRTPKVVPPMPEAKGMAWDYFFNVDNMPGPSLGGTVEEVDAEEDNNRNENNHNDRTEEGVRFDEIDNVGPEEEPRTPERVPEVKEKELEHSKTAPPEFRKVGKAVDGDLDPKLKEFRDLDDLGFDL